jgi:predicted nucleotidyltransferase/HEPN domain-containing protein
MRTSLSHLPERKQADIARIVELIHSVVREHRSTGSSDLRPPTSDFSGLEKIILFGSHARGDWVFDHYVEDGITYEYVSDYDILVVTEEERSEVRDQRSGGSEGLANQHAIWDEVRDRFYRGRAREGPDSAGVSLIVHTIKEVNRALEEGRYFFADIQREGIMLYDAQRTPLADRRETTPQERLAKAKEEFENWFGSATRALEQYEFCLHKSNSDPSYLKNAAFHLHQATEHLYTTVSMVISDYRPKLHDLYKLRKRIGELDRRTLKGFAMHTDEQRRLFKLLADAYIHARYTKTYTITREELDYLAQRVRKLRAITDEVCLERIVAMAS